MKEILEFIFSSFWHWLGTFVFLVVLVRWRLCYFNISGYGPKSKKKSDEGSFWQNLSDIGKKPPNDENKNI